MKNNILKKVEESEKELQLTPLKVTDGWHIQWNHFMDVDVGEIEVEDETWLHFSEDLLFLRNGIYTIDLGWYEELNEKGLYRITFEKNKEEILKYESRSQNEIRRVIDYLLVSYDNIG